MKLLYFIALSDNFLNLDLYFYYIGIIFKFTIYCSLLGVKNKGELLVFSKNAINNF